MNGDGGCFAPTTDHDDSMDVIGHDDKGIQFNEREMVRDVLPTTLRNFSCLVQPYLAVHRMPEQAFPIPRADRHEICPRLGAAVLEVVVGATLVIARIRFAAIVRANTRFAPTEGGRNRDGVCRGRIALFPILCRGVIYHALVWRW